jgi:hypothetical protein
MIHYFCTAEHSYTIGIFAAFYAQESAKAIRIIPYQALTSIRSFGPGTFIFTDMDRLRPTGRSRLTELSETLSAHGGRVLNHPERTLGRFPLLRRLHDAGINQFNVFRLADWQRVTRFPVFIRRENEHGKSITDLIDDRTALSNAVQTLKDSKYRDLMIVEFGNRPEQDRRYRKYASFRVGDTIYCQHCYASREWWVKFSSSDLGEERKRELAAFILTNPHSDQLRSIFDVAQIQYGRADFCVVDGKVQIFEINTNPTIIQATAGGLTNVKPYAVAHEKAMVALANQPCGSAEVANPLFRGDEALDVDAVHEKEIAYVRNRWPVKIP